MKKRQVIFFSFVICFILAILLFLTSQKGFGIGMVMQVVFSPLQKTVLHTSQSFQTSSTQEQLQEENTKLKTQLAKQQLLEKDNVALRDQFQTQHPASLTLLPAHIVGMPSFFPGNNMPESLVIDAGQKDGVDKGMVVVVKDNMVGVVTKTNTHFSFITVVSNKQTAFTVKTAQTNALGVIRGQGNGQLLLDTVVLSDTLKVGDMVVTNGDISVDGKGYPPGLIIGKITYVEKTPSALFQKAHVESLVHIAKIPMVFVMMEKN